MLNTALNLRRLGVSTVPCRPASKHFDTLALKNRGYSLSDLKSALPTTDDLESWFQDSNWNMAILTNDRLIVVDFDSPVMYNAFRKNVLSYTRSEKSNRGYHLFYELEKPISKPFHITWPGIEIKHSGAAIMVAPSVHPSGKQYGVIENGLLNRFTVLKLVTIDALPFVECGQAEKLSEKRKGPCPATSSFTEFCNAPQPRTDIIGRIKAALPLTAYLESLGFELRPSGDKICCQCPIHKGRSKTSFWIDPVGNVGNCFDDRCRNKLPMDVLNLHCRLNNIGLKRAIFELKSYIGVI